MMTPEREKEIREGCNLARGPFILYCRELVEEIDRMRHESREQWKQKNNLVTEIGKLREILSHYGDLNELLKEDVVLTSPSDTESASALYLDNPASMRRSPL